MSVYSICVQVVGLPSGWLANLTVSISGVKATIDWTTPGPSGVDLENYDVTSGLTDESGFFKRDDVRITIYDQTKKNSLGAVIESIETYGFTVSIKASDGTFIYEESVTVDGSGAIAGPKHDVSEFTGSQCLSINPLRSP
jgi:hypothetical protein